MNPNTRVEPRRVYVAGRVKQIPRVQRMRDALLKAGHEISFDWTGDEGEQRSDWSKHGGQATDLSVREREGVLAADAVVLVGNGCEEGGGGLGCFIEVGMALAEKKPVLVLGPARESVFWYLPEVLRVESVEEVLAALSPSPTDTASPKTEGGE